MDQSLRVAYEFSGFRVDPLHRTLVRPDGSPVHLKAKAFDTLLYLVEHAHETVSKEALLAAVWTGVVVEENSLTHAVSELRHALGERPDDHRFILTVWGRGYRFIATVRRVEAHAGTSRADPGRTVFAGMDRVRWLIAAATVSLVVAAAVVAYWRVAGPPDPPSIAVLPFEALGTGDEDNVLVTALHDDVLTQLARLDALKVISRSSVMQYRDNEADLPRIADDLGVATLLEGTAQIAGGRLRLNVRLVDAQSSTLLWSENYDREPTVQDVVAIQTDIVRSIADELNVQLGTGELARLDTLPTENSRAYEFYVSGRQYARGRDLLRDLPASVLQYERAVAEDPQFALAFAQLAIESIHMYWTMDRSDARRASALAAAERALELQPDLPEAHLAMAWYHYQAHLDYESALQELAIAERGMPGDADLLHAKGSILRRMGRLDETLIAWNRALEIDPRNPNLMRTHATNYLLLRDYEQADALLDRVLEIAPDAVEARVAKAELRLLGYGDDEAYLRAVSGNPLLRPGEEILARWQVAFRARDFDEALRLIAMWEPEVISDTRNHFKLKSSLLGTTYLSAGQPEIAAAHFESARRQLENLLGERGDEPRLMIGLGEALVGEGERDAGIEIALEAMRLMPRSREAMDGSVYQVEAILRVLAPAGDVEASVAQLDDYLAHPGMWSIEGLLPDPRFDSLRADPRFDALVQKYKR